jgi:hypothetical protein
MSPRTKAVVFVCIAVFAFTAIVAVPMFALLDAQTPIDALFSEPTLGPAPSIEDVALPSAPVLDVRSPRGPPLA